MELTPSQSASLESMADIAADMGFDIAHLGGGTWAVNGVPADIAATNPAELLAAMADDAAATGTHDTAALRSAAALALARASAIRAGRALSTDEMEALAADLMRLPAPTYTPDGLRTIVTIENPYIDQLFS